MLMLYQNIITPIPQTPTSIAIPRGVVWLNIYNMSPFRVTCSVLSGYPDLVIPPRNHREGVKLPGTELSLNNVYSLSRALIITDIDFNTGQGNTVAQFMVAGFMKNEDWKSWGEYLIGTNVPG